MAPLLNLSFDESADCFIFEANDFDTSDGVINVARQYLEEFKAQPGKNILIYRDNPISDTMNWSQIMTIPEHGSDEFIEILKDRKIAGIVQSKSR